MINMHRISIHVGKNEFVIERPGGGYYNTATNRTDGILDLPDEIYAVVVAHERHGHHPDCVICRDEMSTPK
jgi:hypothetical protein